MAYTAKTALRIAAALVETGSAKAIGRADFQHLGPDEVDVTTIPSLEFDRPQKYELRVVIEVTDNAALHKMLSEAIWT